MKKNLFLLGLAVAAMTSCTNDEVVEMKQPTQKAIGFETFVNKGTRAENPNGIGLVDEDITNFWVLANYGNATSGYSLLYASPENVYLDDSDETNIVWKNNTVKYWTNNTYNFAAYAESNESESAPGYVTLNQGTLNISNYALDFTLKDAANNDVDVIPTISNQKDIVADVVTIEGEMNYSEKVGFTLQHLLSKVNFTVLNNGDYPMSITALKISGIQNKGNISIADETDLSDGPTWTLPATEREQEIITIYPIKSYGYNNENDHIAEGTKEVSADFLVLPQDLTNVKVEILAKFHDPNNLNDVIDQKDFTGINALSLSVEDHDQWIPGYFYNYIISLPAAGKKIEFNLADVTDWMPANPDSNDETKNVPIELNPNPNGSTN